MAKDYQKILNSLYENAIANHTNFAIEDALYADKNLLAYARKTNVVTMLMSGYDVITNRFFVMEMRLANKDYSNAFLSDQKNEQPECKNYKMMRTKYFDSIEEYYKYIDGKIYENSCFFGYTFDEDFVKKHKIKINQINFDHLINTTIDDYTSDKAKEEVKIAYIDKAKEQDKTLLEKRGEYFQDALISPDYETFCYLFSTKYDWHYKIYDFFKIVKEEKYKTIKEYCFQYLFDVSKCRDLQFWLYSLIRVFGSNEIIDYLETNKNELYESHRRYFGGQRAIGMAKSQNNEIEKKALIYVPNDDMSFAWNRNINNETNYKYVNTPEEFISEIKKYTINHKNIYEKETEEETKKNKLLKGIASSNSIKTQIKKKFNKFEEHYSITIQLDYFYEETNIGTKSVILDYFFDMVYFLKNDFSDMDLLDFDGLENINDLTKYNFENSILRGYIRQKLGQQVENFVDENIGFEATSETSKNELCILRQNANMLEAKSFIDNEDDLDLRIYYISDLHLEYRIKNYGAITSEDVIFLVMKIARKLIEGATYKSIIIIDGDVCHDKYLYDIFVEEIHNDCDSKETKIIFTMGNHEALDVLGNKKLMKNREHNIKKILNDNEMNLLADSLIYYDIDNSLHAISNEDLWKMSDATLKRRISKARVILFGGSGLVGYTDLLDTHPETDIKNVCPPGKETEYDKFNQLYKKVYRVCKGKNLVVVTHTPKEYWSRNRKYDKGVIYVSGHTHINKYFICTDYQVYEDNQIGYYGCKTTYPKLKYFAINSDVDIFSDYKDGIYKITENDYINFMRGKNISMNLNRYYDNFLMLKREGYYLFLVQSVTGRLYILNGGASKTLYSNDVNYFYDHMLEVINNINYAFNDYLNRQKEIAKEVKRFGGDGTIHGCIIDIDFYNHIYLNPLDGTLTPYFAENMSWRDIYPSVSLLLKDKCPKLYTRYQNTYDKEQYKEIGTTSKNEVEQLKHRDEGTYPYYYSRILKKIQKVEKNILTEWIEEKPLSGLREGTKRDIEEQDQRELIYKKKQ